ncbi:MAG: hypothetical protein KDD06_04055 [Phaeodactylibacter sp.]|nr:hypothetical protein [Phaeodactylibacter sp.]MCB9291318.1 hypothetical protein [Lewinellaceae bacterium]
MSRNKKSSKAETVIILIIFLVGAFGAFHLFAGGSSQSNDPSHSLETPSEMAQLSTQDVYR